MPSETSAPLITPDTNVCISGAILSQSATSQLIRFWEEGVIDFALCELILTEITDVLSRPYFRDRIGWTSAQINEYVSYLREGSLIVPATTPVQVSRDPKDNMIFACAIEAQVDWIVSGDKDVLAVGTYRGIPTLTPRACVEHLQANRVQKIA